MAGRGDNNKHGSAGRGSSNQSNQPFISDGEKQPASNHARTRTGTRASQASPKTADPGTHRNMSLKKGKSKKG